MGRFRLINGEVVDSFTDKNYRVMDMPSEYIKVQYQPGFVQPYECVEGKMVIEDIEENKLDINYMIDEPTLLKNFLPLLCALEFLHKENRVYGSLSPDDILVSNRGYLLYGFGEGKKPKKTNAYSAYELYAYNGSACIQSDIYSVATIMYQLLTGMKIETADTRYNISEDGDCPVEPLVAFGVSDHTDEVISKALSLFKDDRYTTITEFMNDLYGKGAIEKFKHDWQIYIKKIKYENEDIALKIEKEKQKDAIEESEKRKPITDNSVKKNNKILVIIGMACGMLIFVVIVILSLMGVFSKKPPEQKHSSIQMTALPVTDLEPDYGPDEESVNAVSSDALDVTIDSVMTQEPTVAPTIEPTVDPAAEPTVAPTIEPTVAPTVIEKNTKQPKKTTKPLTTKQPKSKSTPTKKPAEISLENDKITMK